MKFDSDEGVFYVISNDASGNSQPGSLAEVMPLGQGFDNVALPFIPASVPEPATFLLAAVALAGFYAGRRVRRP